VIITTYRGVMLFDHLWGKRLCAFLYPGFELGVGRLFCLM
jgi:hypothetical protein